MRFITIQHFVLFAFAGMLFHMWHHAFADEYFDFAKNIALDEQTEYISEWYISGPFPTGGSAILEQEVKGVTTEKKMHRFITQKYNGKQGKAYWIHCSQTIITSASADPNTGEIRNLQIPGISLLELYQNSSISSSAYAIAFIDSCNQSTRTLSVGSDDGIRMWLNGEEILRIDKERPIVPDQDLAIARFKTGLNVLLVRVENKSGFWGFTCRILPIGKPASLLPKDSSFFPVSEQREKMKTP